MMTDLIAALERSARWLKTESEVLLHESQSTSDFYRSEAELIYAHIAALRDLTREEWWQNTRFPFQQPHLIVRERLERKP